MFTLQPSKTSLSKLGSYIGLWEIGGIMNREILHYLKKKKCIGMSNNHINYTFIHKNKKLASIWYIYHNHYIHYKYHLKKPKTWNVALYSPPIFSFSPTTTICFPLSVTLLYFPLSPSSTVHFFLYSMDRNNKYLLQKFYFLICIYLALANM